MMNKKSIKKKLLACVCLIAVLLAGCGGKSGSIGSLKDVVKGSEEHEIILVDYDNAELFIAGNSIIEVTYAEDKKPERVLKLTYDERGNHVHSEIYTGDFETNSHKTEQQYIYDDNDRLIEKITVREDGNYYWIHGIKHEYENDQISGWTDYSGKSSDGKSIDEGNSTYEEYKLSYNEKGQLESAASESEEIKFTYNDKGLLEKKDNYKINDGAERLVMEEFYNGNSPYWFDSEMLGYKSYDTEGNLAYSEEYKSCIFYMKDGTITPKEEGQAAVITSASTTYEMYGGEPVATQSKWYLEDGQEALSMDYVITDMDNEEAGVAINNVSYATCDENGRVSERWNNGDYRDFTYDDRGNLISRTLYREDGTASWYQRNEYDKNNNLIIEKVLPEAKILKGRVNVYEYDEHNQAISYKSYRVENWEDSDLKSDLASSSIDVSKLELFDYEEYVNEYDSDGNRISCTTKHILKGREESDYEDLIHVYSYGKDGRVIKEEISEAGEEEVDTVIEWEYFN